MSRLPKAKDLAALIVMRERHAQAQVLRLSIKRAMADERRMARAQQNR